MSLEALSAWIRQACKNAFIGILWEENACGRRQVSINEALSNLPDRRQTTRNNEASTQAPEEADIVSFVLGL